VIGHVVTHRAVPLVKVSPGLRHNFVAVRLLLCAHNPIRYRVNVATRPALPDECYCVCVIHFMSSILRSCSACSSRVAIVAVPRNVATM
jgi:hypothetical protein